MNTLTLSFLGTPAVSFAGQMVKFRTRKELALLIYLVVEGGLHARPKLMSLFWPESDAAHGRMMLRRTLADLRHHLADATNDPNMVHFRAEHDLLGVTLSASVELDLRALDATAPQASSFGRAERLSSEEHRLLLAHLQAILDASLGPFLEGFSLPDAAAFETWVSIQRASVHRQLDHLFDRLSTLQMEGGEIAQAIETANRWVAFDPVHELAVRRLMQLYFVVGNRDAALRVYEAGRGTLAHDLGTQPASETVALAAQIRRDLSLTSTVRETRSAVLSPPVLKSPLVGRAREYATLIESYQDIVQGQLRVVSVEGEAGIGKTRLVTDFLGWAVAQGADVLQGRAFESGGRLPYQPVAEMLRSRLERENAPDDLLSDVWLVELSRLLPELRDRYPDLPSLTPDEGTAQTRLQEAVARLGLALASRRPLVLFLDDVQWVDGASLDLLHVLGQRWKEHAIPALLLLSLRTEAVMTMPDLAAWVASMERDLPLRRVTLSSLTYEETMHMVQGTRMGRSVQGPETSVSAPPFLSSPSPAPFKEFIRWLFRETQGQPLYLLETLKALLEHHLLTLVPYGKSEQMIEVTSVSWQTIQHQHMLPAGVRDVIRTRLTHLPPAALLLLMASAVFGHGASFEQLRHVAELGENETLTALDETVKRSLLREGTSEDRNGAPHAYFFTHDKIRDVVYTETGDARRRIFHRRAFEVFSQVSSKSQTAPAVLAYHAFAAGLFSEALHFGVMAGDEAMHLFAVRDAIAFYEQAHLVVTEHVGLLYHHDRTVLSDLYPLYIRLGRAYELINDRERAYMIYQELLIVARAAKASPLEVAALNHLAMLVAQDGFQIEQALELLQQARMVVQQSEDRTGEAETEWNVAQVNYYASKMDLALEHASRALTLASALGRSGLHAQSLNLLAYVRRAQGAWEEAKTDAEHAWSLYVTLGNRAMEADCIGILADIEINTGKPQGGLEMARLAFVISVDIENRWGQVNSAIHITRGLLECGKYAEALAVAKEGVLLARDLHFPLLLVFMLTMLGATYRALLQFSQARETHLEALEINATLPSQRYTSYCFAELCADAVFAREWEVAQNYAQQVVASRNANVIVWAETPRWTETAALMRGGFVEMATEGVRQFGEQFGSRQRCRISYLRALAILARAGHEKDQAQLCLQEALRLSEEMNLPGEQWQMLIVQGSIYQESGETEQAKQACTQADAILQGLAEKIEEKEMRTKFLSSAESQVSIREED